MPCTIHLNYRSARHVAEGRQEAWLRAKGFAPNGEPRLGCRGGRAGGWTEGGGVVTAAPHTLLFLRHLGALRSAVSSGVPNGPYSGPVYSKAPPARVASCLGFVILLCAAAHRQPRVPRRC